MHDNEKNKNSTPPLPHNFSNGPSLKTFPQSYGN